MTDEERKSPDNGKRNSTQDERNSDLVPLETWAYEVEQGSLGPVGIVEALLPIAVITGRKLEVFVNSEFSLGELADIPLTRVDPLMLLMLIEKLCAEKAGAMTVLVSDRNTSHAVTPIKAVREESFRLYYQDPWYDSSFLQEGMNIARVCARNEGKGIFSIGYSEYVKVIVAMGFVHLGPE